MYDPRFLNKFYLYISDPVFTRANQRLSILHSLTLTVCPRSSDSFHMVRYYIKWVTTVCPGSSDPFYVVTYNIKWVTTSWTHST